MRAWELFSLIMIPVLAGFFVSEKMSSFILPVLNTLFFTAIIGWLYSIGSVFNHKLSQGLRKSEVLFRINVMYSSVFAGVLFFNIASLQSKLFNESSFLIIFSIYFIFASFHCFYFASKALVMCEIGRDINFENHTKEFFLLIVFVIGIWLLQPRINKLIAISSE
jgi:hypothetical protein